MRLNIHAMTVVILLSFTATLFGACGGGNSNYLMPVDTGLKPWVSPDAEDLVSDDGGSESGQDGFEDYEDYEDEEDAGPKPPEPSKT